MERMKTKKYFREIKQGDWWIGLGVGLMFSQFWKVGLLIIISAIFITLIEEMHKK